MKQVLLSSLAMALIVPQIAALAQQPGHQALQIDKVQRAQRSQLSDKKSFKLSYVPDPDPIPMNRHFRLKLLLQNATNKPLDGALLKVDATMPEHNHGMNVKPKVKALGQGRYEVQGFLFHMPGYWEVRADIEHGGKREQVVFGINVEIKPTQDHGSHQGH